MVKNYGYIISNIYTDVASGSNDKRRVLKRMFSDAAKGKFDYVVDTTSDIKEEDISNIIKLLKNEK